MVRHLRLCDVGADSVGVRVSGVGAVEIKISCCFLRLIHERRRPEGRSPEC